MSARRTPHPWLLFVLGGELVMYAAVAADMPASKATAITVVAAALVALILAIFNAAGRAPRRS